MQNGYFRLVNQNDGSGFGVALYQPQGGGEKINVDELAEYLDGIKVGYERVKLEMLIMTEKDGYYRLGTGQCPTIPETYHLTVSQDGMIATARFIPPSESGERITFDDFYKDLKYRNITYGINVEALQTHFQSDNDYCTDIVIARGKEPVQGEDARIEYNFNTELHRRPAQREDGSVDYFHMTTINHCRKGEELARIIPENPGENGYDVYGQAIKPREVKHATLKFGRNIELSEDKHVIRSMVDGHVTLVDDKVFVSDVYEVKNVDVSTGNLEFDGSIEISGNVVENFEVKAGGNVIINGLVEGARIIAGGNIIIAKGMNGMGKGYLKAGGDVIVKFLENVRVVTGGYVETEAILHSRVSAGGEVHVDGRKGIIVGGYVQAGTRVSAKVIGASMGSSTIIEVGVNPLIKTQYNNMQKKITDHTKTIKNAEVILMNFKDKMKKGLPYNESQIKYMKSVAKLVEEKTAELEQMNQYMEKLRNMMEIQKQAEVVVNDELHPGTTIIIGETSKTIQTSYRYCKFVKERGEVCMAAL